MIYTIERYREFDHDFAMFLKEHVPKISKMFGDKFNFKMAMSKQMLEQGHVLVCKRDGVITGFMVAELSRSIFDYNIKLFTQILLYVKPDSGRTAYHLFKKFIDIGKTEADHIITMLTSQTNIKPATLERMGFTEMETLYRMEV